MQKNVEKFGISDKRGRVRTSLDPFVSDQGLPEPTLCRGCHAIFQHKRWVSDADLYRELKTDPDAHWVTCPACKKIAEGYPEGILTLRGDYLWEHETEIANLLSNEESKAAHNNPQERVIRQLREGDELIIETTEQRLAEHLGRVLHRAHHGQLKIDWEGGPEICRVYWERAI